MLSRPLAVGSSLLFVALALAACSSTSSTDPSASSSSGSSGKDPQTPDTSPKISTGECNTRCEAKATGCGAPSSEAKQICAQLCDGAAPTEAQITCLEGAACSELIKVAEKAESLEEVYELMCASPSGGSNPASLTVKGTFGSVTPQHTVGTDDKMLSMVSLTVKKPSFRPSKPSSLPQLSSINVQAKVTAPDPGACTPTISYQLDWEEFRVIISGKDPVRSSTDCEGFTDAIAKNGFSATLENVPYEDSSPKATVTIDLKP